MKTCNWEDLLTQDSATWDELCAALWEGYEDKMELVLVYKTDDGTEWEFGVSHYGEKFSLKWSEENTPKTIRRSVEDFLSIVDLPSMHRQIIEHEWQCSGDFFEGRFLYHADLPNRPHAVVFFRVYHNNY